MFLNDFCEWILRNQITLIGLSTCVTLPSVLLYIAEIVTVLRHKQFHSSFYALFIARALADLLHTLNSYFNYKLPIALGNLLFGVYLEFPNWVLTLSIFLGMYCFQALNLATVFISFNRLSIVLVPMDHDKLWSVALLPASILITFVAPLANLILIAKMDVILVTTTTNSSLSFIMGEGPKTNLLPLITDITSVVASLSLIICLIINFATLLQYKKKINVAAEITESQRLERKLGIYALHTFAGHMTVSVLMIGMSISHKIGIFTVVMTIYSQYAYVMDWCTVVLSSWLLFWASSSFRQQFVDDFVPKWLQRIMIGEHSQIGGIGAIRMTTQNNNNTNRVNAIRMTTQNNNNNQVSAIRMTFQNNNTNRVNAIRMTFQNNNTNRVNAIRITPTNNNNNTNRVTPVNR